ncbi:MAG TPA: hypothetical protein VG892_07645 [Terriglobales bacterium]|nr:hypothetical protein [Terriglobales bacterium]
MTTCTMLREGWIYRDGHGDLHGPMELRDKKRGQETWLDQHGALYHSDGRQWGHTYDSAGNLISPVSMSSK